MLEHTKAVIFDLDGTLVDSMWVWTAIDEDYIRKYHLNPPEDFHEAMEGMSYTETAQYFLKIFPELPHTVEEIKKEWYDMSVDKYTKEVTLKPGVKEFLEMLKEKGIRTGIATSNDRKLVEEFLKARQITHLFDTICTSCEVNKGKPAPDVYLAAAKALNVSPENCLVFEDVPMGILAGKNAGMKVCAVEDSYSKEQMEQKKKLADYYIKDYDEVLNQTFEVLK